MCSYFQTEFRCSSKYEHIRRQNFCPYLTQIVKTAFVELGTQHQQFTKYSAPSCMNAHNYTWELGKSFFPEENLRCTDSQTCTSNDSSPTSNNKNNVININLENKRCKTGVFPSVKTTTAQIYWYLYQGHEIGRASCRERV